MVETIVENDDGEELMAKYVEGEEIGEEDLKASLRKSVIAMKIFPVICGTAFKNKGVQPLLDAVVDFLPSPLDIPPVKGKNPDTGEEEIRKPRRQRALRRAGIQDHDRSLRRPVGIRSRLFRRAEERRQRLQPAQAAE